MIAWAADVAVYLHRDPVDFRKQINGLTVLIEQELEVSAFARALFVFCNRRHSQLKVIYWDETGFCLWQKRLEKAHFQWPKRAREAIVEWNTEQWNWLLRGFDVARMKPHETLHFE
jgi:transposase